MAWNWECPRCGCKNNPNCNLQDIRNQLMLADQFWPFGSILKENTAYILPTGLNTDYVHLCERFITYDHLCERPIIYGNLWKTHYLWSFVRDPLSRVICVKVPLFMFILGTNSGSLGSKVDSWLELSLTQLSSRLQRNVFCIILARATSLYKSLFCMLVR